MSSLAPAGRRPDSAAVRPLADASGSDAPAPRPALRALAAVATAIAAGIGALASGRSWARMADMHDRMGGRGMWPTGPAEAADAAANPPRIVLALVVLAVALGVAVWWSARHPRAGYGVVLALTAAYLALHGPVPAAIVAPAISLGWLARRRPPGEWVAWSALLLPAFWAHAWTEPAFGLDAPATYLTILFGVAWTLIPALLLQSSGARRAAAAAAREEELHRVAYEERLRVARDIHDVVGHSLSMISLQSGVALHVLDTNPEQARASLQAIRDASKGSLAELRHTLGVFRGPDEDQPLVPTPSLAGVPALVESVRAGGREVGLALPPDAAARVPASVQTVAYRVVQESLTNVVRHAPRATAAVTLDVSDAALTVRVLDDGPARAVPPEGHGLRGMRERVEAVGGTLHIGVRPTGGLAVEAVLPLRDGRLT